MSKISNTITLLNLLSTGKKYSIDELSKIIEVSPRMIRTYKEELEKSGIYIDSIMGPYGGYVLNQSIKLPSRKFKKEDSELLEEIIQKELNPNRKEKLITLKNKIKGITITKQGEELKLTGDTLIKYNILTRAIKEKRKVKLLYTSFNNGRNERIIDPEQMFLLKEGWYCVAFCELRKDIRHFEINRIQEIKMLDEKF